MLADGFHDRGNPVNTPTLKQSARILWIDNLKAIGIFLVVWSHHELEMPPFLLKYIYAFHMPLFFIVSGYLFQPSRYENANAFLRRRVRTLVVPYLIFSLITYTFWAAKTVVRSGARIPISDFLLPLLGIPVSSNGLIFMAHNPPLWFLTCLFVVETFFYILFSGLKKRHTSAAALWLILAVSGILGYLLRQFVPFRFPWGLDTSFTVLIFYGAGFLLRGSVDRLMNILASTQQLLLAAALLVLCAGSAAANDFVNLVYNRMGQPLLFYAAGFAGTLGLSLLSQTIRANRWLRMIGSNTLLVLAFHIPTATIAAVVLRVVLGPAAASLIVKPVIWSLVLSTLQMLLMLPLIYSVNRWFPSTVGRPARA